MKTKLTTKYILPLMILCIGRATPLLAQNLISNGQFETPTEPYLAILGVGSTIPGWTVVGPSFDNVHHVYQPITIWTGNPSQFMDLTGFSGSAGIQSDAFNTIIGHEYEVTFDAFNGSLVNPGEYNGPGFTLQATGYSPVQFSLAAGTGTTATYDFTATSASTSITFMDASGFDSNAGWIDNVSVMAVPEPSTIGLVLFGLMTICVRGFRTKHMAQ